MSSVLCAPRIPVEEFELGCGAKLLVSRREGAPVAAVQLHFRGGHSLDPTERLGTAHLTGKLVEYGTARHTEEEIAALLEPWGGNVSGGSTGLVGSIANEEWKLLLDLAAEVTMLPTFPEEKFQRQRQRLLDRLLVERDDPRVQGAQLFRRLVYGQHWLGSNEYGTIESIGRIERAHLAEFHASSWCASRAVIAFCGDVEPAAVKRFLDRRLASWSRGAKLASPDETFPPIEARSKAFESERQLVHVYLGHLGIKRTHPDYASLVVMDHVLGTGPGFTNRISKRLRDELGLAYTVHASIHSSAGILPGTFTAYIGTSAENVVTAIEGFRREIRRMQGAKVGKEELELVRSYLTGSFVLGFERASRRAQHMVAACRNGLGHDHLAALVESFRTVTADDVRRVAREHLFPDRACIVTAGPFSERDLARLDRPRAARGRRRSG